MTNFTMLVRNRYNLTKQALESLIDTVMHEMNLTIVDDRSDEATCDLLNLYGAIRNETPMGTGPLRNMVIAASGTRYGRGDYLYLSDNDVFFKPGWLERLINAYNSVYPQFQVLGAYNHPFHRPVKDMWYIPDHPTHGVYEVNALATQSMLMRWEVWDKYGPFCTTPVDKVCQSEDVDFTNKIRADGFKLGVVSPALVVNCGITNSFGERIPGYELVKRQCPQGVICE